MVRGWREQRRQPSGPDLDPVEAVALRRLHLLRGDDAAEPLPPTLAVPWLAELTRLGVVLHDAHRLDRRTAPSLRAAVTLLRTMRGEHGTYTPLFPGFPDRLPDRDDARVRFYAAAARLAARHGFHPIRVTTAELREALDFSAWGWWPASSVPQDVDVALAQRRRQDLMPPDTRVEAIHVRVVDGADLTEAVRGWARACLVSPSSLREDVRADLVAAVEALGCPDVTPQECPFRENRAVLMAHLWRHDPGRLAAADVTPDDVLRLFATLTDTDASLSTTIRYPRLSRPQRRVVADLLERSPRLDDVFRRRGLWLAILRGLRPDRATTPRLATVTARLRRSRHDPTSTASRVERALAERDPSLAAATLAAEAPGLLLRRLRHLARLAETEQERAVLLASLDGLATVPLRVLHLLIAQVRDNGETYPRPAFLPDGGSLLIRREPGHLALEPDWAWQILATLEDLLARQYAQRPPGPATFHVDPALTRVMAPDQLRSTAPGLVQAGRGTWLPLGDAAVLRFFLHWRQPGGSSSDLDLSLVALDEGLVPVAQVSWTNLAAGAMTHSGDLTSAPAGAQEFIDVRLAEALRQGWRYLAPMVFRYAGPGFDALPEAWLGWMLREDCSADRRTFDPATVVNAFPLTGPGGVRAPILVDVSRREAMVLDLHRSLPTQGRVERDAAEVGQFLRALVAAHRARPSLYEVVATAFTARGGRLVSDPAEAEVTVGLDDSCTFNALRPEALLAEIY